MRNYQVTYLEERMVIYYVDAADETSAITQVQAGGGEFAHECVVGPIAGTYEAVEAS